ncbi:iron chaperone [Alkalibacillus aidingensis]|uniref:iron chaperone n=1 Tax=Alkalibacillus aidingensis TaxID=2747607 RepID=UPI001660F5D7|nr:iron chaperone [Alkalibacillus aidingensis]
MEIFEDFLANIDQPQHRARVEEVLDWIAQKFPDLKPEFKWNQPMFTDHGTFIIGFSVSKKHMAVAPEREGIIRFSEEIIEAGYDHTKMLVRFPWDRPVDYSLLEKMIEFNIKDKEDCATFWRK